MDLTHNQSGALEGEPRQIFNNDRSPRTGTLRGIPHGKEPEFW
jgi:hypothetical protein